jgi:hypothetical protein
MEINYYHEYSEVYCVKCGFDEFDPFNVGFCPLCMGNYCMHFTCEVCLDIYDMYENQKVCPI